MKQNLIPLAFTSCKASYKPNVFLGITTFFPSNLQLRGQDFKEHQLFQFKTLLPQATTQTKTCFATGKILQNFEACDLLTAYTNTITIFQSGENNGLSEI